ncbi:histidinol-phosphate transaminase [Lactococcus nasutitermitis]|uniref:Histidinol-phosphate aminotransferase n=1 Tax=Lactococcus nasutitermitis TaxID=1652957 RepID=A0ABV9JFP2_9LACT|nr:histidinol-phosphate transaminase [Lactococcus nasutitermitis]
MTWKDNLRDVEPYVSGEQPKLSNMIKLNTNENPYPPSPKVAEALKTIDSEKLRLYPNADAEDLRTALAAYYGLAENQIFIGNGSDEVLSLSFLTFFNSKKPVFMPDISYSFYPVYAELYKIPIRTIPVQTDFSLKKEDYFAENGGVIFPNPNAPTGILTGLDFIEDILRHNPDVIVLVDEAYIDFGGKTALPLLEKYENIVITRTFSKSRSLAGIRLGLAFGSPDAIARLYDVKNSFNSYTIDHVAQAVGLASLSDESYFQSTLAKIVKTRETFIKDLKNLDFEVLPSMTNFVFVKHAKLSGQTLFDALYAEKIIVRHWNHPRIKDWLRITIGTDEEMTKVIRFLENYLNGK